MHRPPRRRERFRRDPPRTPAPPRQSVADARRHPDKNVGREAEAADAFQQLTAAFNLLSRHLADPNCAPCVSAAALSSDEQLVELGRGLQRAVTSYNRALGSLESRVLVTARKLGERSGATTPLVELPLLDVDVRGIDVPDAERTD